MTKRYFPQIVFGVWGAEIGWNQDADGDYVKYSDIEHLILENEALRERLRQKEREIDNLNKLGRIQERNLRRFREDDW